MKPYLILDAYLDELGGARNLLPRLAGRAVEVRRVAKGEELPKSATCYAGILVTGSAASILDPPAWIEPAAAFVRDSLRLRTPYLGFCFGHQLLGYALCGARGVVPSKQPELGWVCVQQTRSCPLFEGLPAQFTAFASHRDEVAVQLPGAMVLARSPACAVEAIAIEGSAQFGVQFHPEMGFEEAKALVGERLGVESCAAHAALAAAVDTQALGDRIVANFLRG